MKRTVKVGDKFGKLTVVSQLPSRYNKKYWLCQCECGNNCEKSTSALITATGVLSCGCYRPPYREDLRGHKFNKLTVIDFDIEYNKQLKKKNPNAKIKWTCQCDCGNVCYAGTSDLKRGHKQSCGCLQKEKAAITMQEKVQPLAVEKNFQDLTGQRFGYWTVLNFGFKDKNRHSYWHCKCKCGNEKDVAQTLLKTGQSKSCGCLGNSVGEELIKEILEQAQIPFKQEVTFTDLVDKNPLRYDFAIYSRSDNKLIGLIEYDGRQHTDSTSQWHNETLVRHDKMKNEYALRNHIPLLRIDYQDKDKISISYILEGLLASKENF